MADEKSEKNVTSKPQAPAAPSVERLTPPHGRRLPEPFYLVRDEVTYPQLQEKGHASLKRERGISKTNAERAGIELPQE